jgi:5-methylcytosine-specific restriction endonuclease McrA
MWCTACAEDVADQRVGGFVKRRDRSCVACGKKGDLTWAHVLRRRYRRIRWNPRNAVALCIQCHEYLDTNKDAHRAFFRKRFPGLLEELNRLKDTAPRADLAEILTTYRGRAA